MGKISQMKTRKKTLIIQKAKCYYYYLKFIISIDYIDSFILRRFIWFKGGFNPSRMDY